MKSYDTLKSEMSLVVTGESLENLSIASNDLGDFYDSINEAENTLKPLKDSRWIGIVMNILIALILGVSIYLFIKKPAA